jgi:mycofactocin system glycosyltransferase
MVTIIGPAHGRPAATRACIESLLVLDYPAERTEIIVVDDATEPPLALGDLPVRLLRQNRNIGQSAARNLAALQARGELLAFIDNDCVAKPGWLRTLVPYLSEPTVGVVGGRVVAPSLTGSVSAFEAVRSPLDMGPIGGEVGPHEVVSYLPACNLIVRRELLLAQGGFDATMRLGEDVDFIWRALDAGTRACYVPNGQVVHYHRVRLWSLLCRRADYGSSEADLQQFHPQGRRLMRLPIAATALLAMLAMLTVYWPASVALGMLAVTGVAFELNEKFRLLRRIGVDVPAHRVSKAVLREHMAAFYHLSANVIRYYSLPLLAIGLVWPNVLPALVLLLLIAPITDHRRLKPSLSLPRFVGLYWLEMAAYQLGVWRGCLKRGILRPLLPTLRLAR